MSLFITLALSCGLMAFASTGYGVLMRTNLTGWLKQISIGSIFGLGATVGMLDPFVVAPGIIIDGRSLFVGLAAGFLGPVGAIVALLMSLTTRVAIGSVGMFAGVLGLCLVTILALLWRFAIPRLQVSRITELLALGATITLSIAMIGILPEGVRLGAFRTAPYLALYLIVGSVVFGLLLDRERRTLLRENDLALAVATDPLTGLFNRRRLKPAFETAVATTGDGEMAVLIIDVDHLKLSMTPTDMMPVTGPCCRLPMFWAKR